MGLERFNILIHLGGKIVDDGVVRYFGEKKSFIGKWHEDPDYMNFEALQEAINENGFETPTKMAYKRRNVGLAEGGKIYKFEIDILELVQYACEDGIADLYVEANEKPAKKDFIDDNVNSLNVDDGIVMQVTVYEGCENSRRNSDIGPGEEDVGDMEFDTWLDMPNNESTDEGTNESDDEELMEARRLRRDFKKKVHTGFQYINEQMITDVGDFNSKDHKVGILEETEVGYMSEYESSDQEQHIPPNSDEDDIFLYRANRKKTILIAYNPKCDHKQLKIVPGMTFADKKECKDAIQKYAIENGYKLRFVRSSNKKLEAKCSVIYKKIEGSSAKLEAKCPWRAYAGWYKRRKCFVIKTVGGDHMCSRVLNNPQANAKFLAEAFIDKFKVNPNWPVKEIEAEARSKYLINVNLWTCYRARAYAFKILHGTLEQHYSRLRSYIAELKRVDKQGTFVFEPEERTNCVFKRLYIEFSDLMRGFKSGCKCVFGLDGAFLKTIIGGCLLAAVGRDANNQMYPIVWAVVDTENGNNWEWFMNQLCCDLDIQGGFGWTDKNVSHCMGCS